MVKILMMSATMATSGFLKIKPFWKKDYDVIIPVHDFTNKILSSDSKYNVNVDMWPSLVTLAFLWEKLSWPQFYKDLTRKTAFFEKWSWFKFNNLGLALGPNLQFNASVAKRLKLRQKVFGANSYVCISYRGKPFWRPSWICLI